MIPKTLIIVPNFISFGLCLNNVEMIYTPDPANKIKLAYINMVISFDPGHKSLGVETNES